MSSRFHLAIPVRSIEESKEFYCDFLGCEEGNCEEGKWQDINFWGNELTLHNAGEDELTGPKDSVSGQKVPHDQQQAPAEEEPAEDQPTKGPLTVGFGRFNPPTIGHEALLGAIKKTAADGEYKVYPSHSQDAKKNPLDSETKVGFMKAMFPDHANNIVHDTKMRTIFDVLKSAYADGHSEVNIVVGDDRRSEFESLATKYPRCRGC